MIGSAPAPAEMLGRYYGKGLLPYQESVDGKAVFPPRFMEPGTGRPLAWRVSDGRGEVYATTVVRPRDGAPYNVALVQLAEGFRMMSRIDGMPPDEVRIGQSVVVRFDGGVPVFVPA